MSDSTQVFSVVHKLPFAFLFKGTEVTGAFSKNGSTCIELSGYIHTDDILAGRLALTKTVLKENALSTTIREISPVDTIVLYGDTNCTDTIGFTWAVAERNAVSIKGIRDKHHRLLFSVFGLVDTSKLSDVSPWDMRISALLRSPKPFNHNAADFPSIYNFKDTATLDLRYEYTQSNSVSKNPEIETIWVFKFGKLKAVWTHVEVAELNKKIAGKKNLYYCDDSRFYIDKVRNFIVEKTLLKPTGN